ncbi:LysR family transcriptional regulator [Nannocystaceae bacterium ST9]
MGKNAKPTSENAKQVVDSLRWDDLELLLALGREGTLSGAALRLGLNTSTIGRRLDAMEAGLGVHLFDRTPAGIAATELAEALLPIAEAMERAAADALRLIEGRETEPEGLVRVTAPPGLANWFIAPALVELRRRHPKLVIELDASIGYADLTRREADIALRAARPSSGDLIAVKLAEATSVIVAAPDRVRSLGKLVSLDAIDWLTWGRDLANFPDAKWIAANVDPGRIVLRTSSMDAQLHAARRGLGAILLPRPFLGLIDLAELPLERGLAKRMPALPSGSLWLVGHRALRSVPRIQAVWEFVVEQAAKLE